MKDLNKFLWVMVWWAVWDALWEPIEFLGIDEFDWIEKYYHEDPVTKKPFWERTDDTAMALILADSLIRKGFDFEDQLDWYFKRHQNWWMGLKDYPAWEGIQISQMLTYYWMYKEWRIIDKPRETDLTWEKMDWNGSLMRIWPIPLYYSQDPEKALYYAWESSKPTHHTQICISACKYYCWLIWWAMNWAMKEELLTPYYSPVKWYRDEHELAPEIIPVIEWSYKSKDRYQINPSWYVVETLETVLRWFHNWESFKDWMEKTVNLWLDADTTWCIYWYLAWAYYGYDTIPQERKNGLVQVEKIKEYAEKLYKEWN